MALSGALQWWEEWQLRILVLSSQAVHWLLFFALWVRTVHILRRFKPVIWIAFIGNDALAIYALATLFNRHKQVASDGETTSTSTSLEIIWAPLLLIHLGGQPPITAYTLEDNELWRRHVITLVSQVTVALYVFSKWWSGEERMLVAAVLLFILGVVEFSLKPWALWRASFSSMQASTNVSPPAARIEAKAGPLCWMLCTSSYVDLLAKNFAPGGGKLNLSLQEYVQEAKKCAEETKAATPGPGSTETVYKMFVDTSSPYSERLNDLEKIIGCDQEQAHKFIGDDLEYIFQLLYTRLASALTLPGCCLSLLLPFLAIASLVLFAKSNKDGYDNSDVTVTYILLGCTVAQELLPWVVTAFLNLALSKLTSCHDTVSQYSFMSFCVRRKNPTLVMKLAAFNGLREYISKQWYIWQVPAALQITGLVSRHAKQGWRKYIHDVASYKRFNNLRGERAVGRHPQLQLEWSLERPFDQSVFLWHMATDLCFHNHHGIGSTTSGGQEKRINGSRVISNYMMYLLSIHPHMLMLGTRPGILDLAIYELDIILKGGNASLDNQEALTREIMDLVKSAAPVPTPVEEVEQPVTATERKYTVTHIPAACHLAEELMKLGEDARWTVIQGVWVEMLSYSASRCRGYLHAKSLGEGREYLTTVWLLWAYFGMETLASMIQSPEPTEKEGINYGDDDEEEEDEEKKKEEGASTSQFQGQADQPVEMCPV